jgi:hypothetical protein
MHRTNCEGEFPEYSSKQFAEGCFPRIQLKTFCRKVFFGRNSIQPICGAVFFERTASNRFAERCSLKKQLKTICGKPFFEKNSSKQFAGRCSSEE